jgi:hypothetical protein
MLLRHLILFVIIQIFLGIGYASANQAREQELQELEKVQSNLDTQRAWVKYRYDKSLAECYALFWMQKCSDKARVIYLKESKVIRDQEIALHNRQRELNEYLKDEKDQARYADYADPEKVKERAQNRANFEEKQRLRAQREAELEERKKDAEKRAQENRKTSPLD